MILVLWHYGGKTKTKQYKTQRCWIDKWLPWSWRKPAVEWVQLSCVLRWRNYSAWPWDKVHGTIHLLTPTALCSTDWNLMCMHVKAHSWVFRGWIGDEAEEAICIRNVHDYLTEGSGYESAKLSDVKNESDLILMLSISSVLSLGRLSPMGSG